MKKEIKVTQKNRYSKDRQIIFHGYGNVVFHENSITIEYIEDNTMASVKVEANDEYCTLCRKGEIKTNLKFIKDETTTGYVESEFGTFELGIHTHKYYKLEDMVICEYDILTGDEVSDGYRIIWKIKESMS